MASTIKSYWVICPKCGGKTKTRISERMLDRAMKREDSPEARLVFELCLRYCIDYSIDINEVFRSYFHDD